MDYLKFYKLGEEPFRNEPDPRFYYAGPGLERIRMRVLRIIEQRKGLCTVIGESGSGKTTLARQFLEELSTDTRPVRMLSVPHADCDGDWLRRRVARSLGVTEPAAQPLQVLGQIYEKLVAVEPGGQLPLLLIDDAQLLQGEGALDELRGLLSLEHGGSTLLTLVLFGSPALDRLVRQHPALGQRVDGRVCMNPLDRSETEQFLRTRIESVGGNCSIFVETAFDAIHHYSGGVPRMINTLADNTLFEGFLSESKTVDASAVDAAAQQLGLEETPEALPNAAPGRGERADPFEAAGSGDAEFPEISIVEEPDSNDDLLDDSNADSLSGLDALFEKIRIKK